ncbi:MAG: GGDEF domain-containing protein [Spirochaetaceae bacterium]|nr:GGDEF domain-containing protein [Spirochaetaceae bacterium]
MPDQKEIDKLKSEIKDLRELLDISKSLNSNLEYATLLDSLLLTCMGRSMVIKAGLFIKNDIDSREFTLYRNYEGFNPDKNIDYSIDEKSAIISSLLKLESCITMPELLEDIKEISDIKTFTILEPSLIIPIIMKHDLQGIIVLGGRISGTSYSQEEKKFLRSVADLGAIAINNTFLFEVSSTDMMTKLKQRHVLFQNLRDIITTYDEESICLLMLDIDHFKNLNDTYGHSFGDIVIKEIASILLGQLRMEDMAARYGGEEFTVVLRYIQMDVALNIAERIRNTVEKKVFKYENTEVKTTISVGIVSFDPKLDIVPQDIIKRADTALYRAKENGRNQVVQG